MWQTLRSKLKAKESRCPAMEKQLWKGHLDLAETCIEELGNFLVEAEDMVAEAQAVAREDTETCQKLLPGLETTKVAAEHHLQAGKQAIAAKQKLLDSA